MSCTAQTKKGLAEGPFSRRRAADEDRRHPAVLIWVADAMPADTRDAWSGVERQSEESGGGKIVATTYGVETKYLTSVMKGS